MGSFPERKLLRIALGIAAIAMRWGAGVFLLVQGQVGMNLALSHRDQRGRLCRMRLALKGPVSVSVRPEIGKQVSAIPGQNSKLGS